PKQGGPVKGSLRPGVSRGFGGAGRSSGRDVLLRPGVEWSPRRPASKSCPERDSGPRGATLETPQVFTGAGSPEEDSCEASAPCDLAPLSRSPPAARSPAAASSP